MHGQSRRLLLLAWHGADASLLNELADQGAMPHLRSVLESGTMGDLRPVGPWCAAPAWTTVATGAPPDVHGVLTDFVERPDGWGVQPASREDRETPALWSVLASVGLRTSVIGWPATHPAESTQGLFVSDRIHELRGRAPGSWGMAPDAVGPRNEMGLVKELRVHPCEITAAQLQGLLPRANKIDEATDNRLTIIAAILARAATTHNIGTFVAAQRNWDILIVYYDLIERLVHHFGATAHDDPLRGDFLQSIVAGYGFCDLLLGRYINLVDERTTVCVLSAYGVRPPSPSIERVSVTTLQPVHTPGFCLLRGPGIQPDMRFYGGQTIDLAPSICALFGLALPKSFLGRVWQEALSRPGPSEVTSTWDGVDPGLAKSQAKTRDAEDLRMAAAAMQLIADGYSFEPPADVVCRIQQLHRQRRINLAVTLMQQQRWSEALASLNQSHQGPVDELILRLSVQCHVALDDLDACRRVAALLASVGSPYAAVIEGLVAFHERRHAEAMLAFDAARQRRDDQPMLNYYIGLLYSQTGRHPDAVACLSRSLQIDGPQPQTWHALGLSHWSLGRQHDAASCLRAALRMQSDDAECNYHLGSLLVEMGKQVEAMSRLQMTLQVDPKHFKAHQLLAALTGKS